MNKPLQLINLKTRTSKNAKISVFGVRVEAIISLLLHNLHDGTFKESAQAFFAFFLHPLVTFFEFVSLKHIFKRIEFVSLKHIFKRINELLCPLYIL